jgi:hypothetical protein
VIASKEQDVMPDEWRYSFRSVLTLTLLALVVIAQPAAGTATATWETWLHLPGVLDIAGPRSDGRLVIAVRGHLDLLDPSGALTRLAPAYTVGNSPESYITISPGLSVARAGCSFPRDTVYALDLTSKPPGVTAITPTGAVSRLATVAGASGLNAITIDRQGSFGHRVLVIEKGSKSSRVFAVDCVGRVEAIATVGALLEGGIEVAPATFGSFGGRLIAPDENHGVLYAISSAGAVSIVAHPDVPAGPDIGIESIGFVPPAGIGAAYVADRGTPKSAKPHPGTDSILRLTGERLSGVAPGDLLVATEGAGTLVDVRCAPGCTSIVIASGPRAGHIEGHIVVVPGTNALARAPAHPRRPGGSGQNAVALIVLGIVAIGVLILAGRFRRLTRKKR